MAQQQTVASNNVIEMPARRIPRVEDAKRPFKLYHAQRKRFFMWRYYSEKVNALRSALWVAKWLKIGETVEVIDVRNGKLHGSYTRRVDSIEFLRETLKAAPDRFEVGKKELK